MAGIKEIDRAIAQAEAQLGVRGSRPGVALMVGKKSKKAPPWTPAEEAFLLKNHGTMSEEDMGLALGRTASGIHNRLYRELRAKPPSKDKKILTGAQLALGLGTDIKTVAFLIDRGILKGRRLPCSRVIRMVDRNYFVRWAMDPMNWIYFKTERVGERYGYAHNGLSQVYDSTFWSQLGPAIRKKAKAWKDEWLNPVQAGTVLGLKGRAGGHNINKAIHRGTLKASRWGNWWILRSDLPKSGTIDATGKWVPRILTRAELGRRNRARFWEEVRSGKRIWAPWSSRPDAKKRVEKWILKGWHVDLIARKLKVSPTTVCGWMREKWGKGWTRRYHLIRNEKSKADPLKKRIRKWILKGWTQIAVAKKLGISDAIVWKVVKDTWGPNWKKRCGWRRAA